MGAVSAVGVVMGRKAPLRTQPPTRPRGALWMSGSASGALWMTPHRLRSRHLHNGTFTSAPQPKWR